jgi:type II secretory pathway pseudopilin PulG
MDTSTSKNAVVLVVIAAVGAIGVLSFSNVQARRKNAELVAQTEDLQKQVNAMGVAQKSLERQVEIEKERTARATDVADDYKKKNDALLHPPLDNPGCVDSDAKYGKDAIYYRGSVRSGGGEQFDNCRLGQLVEYSCIETPSGSGIMHATATIMDCPGGKACVDGTCVR